MATIENQITVGGKLILEVDSDPSAASGTPAPVGSEAMLEGGGPLGTNWIKVGPLDTAWDKVVTVSDNTMVDSGLFRRVAMYDTDPSGTHLNDILIQNGFDIDVIMEAQLTRSAAITYSIPNPGDAITSADFVLTEGIQTINGDKTFNENVTIQGNLDVNGTLTSIDTVNTTIKDALITLNKGGAVGSASNSGVEFEENSIITGFIKTNAARDGLLIKSPASTGVSEVIGTSADQTYNFPDEDGRMVLQSSVASGVVSQISSWKTDETLHNATGVGADSLTWDSSNQRLGVGTPSPTEKFHVAAGNALFGASVKIRHQDVSDFRQEQDATTTTNGTYTSVKTIAIPLDTVVIVKSFITGRKTGGTGNGTVGDAAVYERTAAFKNVGGTVSRIRQQADFTAEDVNSWSSRMVVSGGNASVEVRGSSNNNMSWESTTVFQILD